MTASDEMPDADHLEEAIEEAARRANTPHEFTASPENEFCGWCGGPADLPAHTDDPEVTDDLAGRVASSEDGFTDSLPDSLAEIIRLLEGVDLEAAVTAIEEKPLPVEDARAAAMNRADRAELVRAFVALQQAGRGIVRRLENDAAGLVRDE